MSAVLAAAGRAVLGAALVLACAAAALWAAYVPPAWRVAWLLLVAAVTGCAVLAWAALWPEGDDDG